MMKIFVLACCAALQLTKATDLVPSHDGLRFVKPTSCEEKDCPHGGCVFRDCNEPVTCKGGLCDFINCKTPDCSGGVCTIVEAEDGSCPGGLCNFVKPKRSLTEAYCTGGLCLVDGKSQVSSPGSLNAAPEAPATQPTQAPAIVLNPEPQSPTATPAATPDTA